LAALAVFPGVPPAVPTPLVVFGIFAAVEVLSTRRFALFRYSGDGVAPNVQKRSESAMAGVG
jgi:hypothetical protein